MKHPITLQKQMFIKLFVCFKKCIIFEVSKQLNMDTQTQDEVINQFIINVSLVNPIQEIIGKLNVGDYRDCDIKWLDVKLEGYIKFAAETFGIKGIVPSELGASKFPYFNSCSKKYYLKHFTTLLDYFKKF